MVKSGIKIYARLKPTKKPTGLCEIEDLDDGEKSTIAFLVPKSESSGYINNKKEIYKFQFNKVFSQETKQEEIFDFVARGVIDNCLEGYNGTIFAYGQTGSGKTFTITGGVEKYVDRGLIPRTLSYLFQQYSKSPGKIFTTHVSYMEIYNESGYDLLDPKHGASALEDLPKVLLMEGDEGNIHLKNLSLHLASNEEEALNWLFLGDTNRMISETPMNMASTRSHCIFTIHISSRETGSDLIRKAKFHLVDLAGSERIGKTGVGGTILTEAKYINLSLHFLEQVIVALSEKNRSHIPYRNSMMTSVLRDSLGGNCMTTMIATCSIEKKNIDESISTCRFSQRVALVKNEALLNEELDPKLMVQRLKQKVLELKDELSLATGEERTDELTEEEREKCVKLVRAYVADSSPEARLMVGGDMRKIQLCFSLLKAEVLKKGKEDTLEVKEEEIKPDTTGGITTAPESQVPVKDTNHELEVELLENRLHQRDDEIRILLRMLKQERKRANRAESSLNTAGMTVRSISPVSPDRLSPLRLARSVRDPSTGVSSTERTLPDGMSSQASSKVSERTHDASPRGSRLVDTGGDGSVRGTDMDGSRSHDESEKWRAALKAELSQARQEAFDDFRKNCADSSGIDQHKKVLRVKYAEAKGLGEKVNTTRVRINKLKARLEKYRIARGVQELTDGSPSIQPDEKEEEIKRGLESEKAKFKSSYSELCALKTEIEHIQHLLQKSKVQIQREFEEWWKRTNNSSISSDDKDIGTKGAWHTPPASSPSKDTRIRSSSHRRRHQQAIAAQFSHAGTTAVMDDRLQSPPKHIRKVSPRAMELSSNGAKTTLSSFVDNSRDRSRVEQTRGSLYQSSSVKSWKQGESISSSSDNIMTSGHASPRKKETDEYLSKQKPLFPSPRRDVHSRSSNDSTNLKPFSPHSSSIPLTGDAKADADIIAFYKARQKLIQKGGSK